MSCKYCENCFVDKLQKCGFDELPGWECLFFHGKLQLILAVYVDDCKLVGKTEDSKAGWDLIMGSGLVLDPLTPLGDYLGCGQFPIRVSATEAQRRLEQVMPLLQQVDGIKDVKTASR